MDTRLLYHFIGIGGIGMSGIARLLLQCGARVSGSDLKSGAIIETLKEQGAVIRLGHDPANLADPDVVVYSSAVKDDNPELREARRRGIKCMRRAEVLARLMEDKTVVTVAGSHGKTTTTSLAAMLLLEAGLHPTVAVGGVLRNIGVNACLGKGAYFVAEADESDGSFLHYRPAYSIITNIDREHLDYYGTFEREIKAFGDFAAGTGPAGCVIYCRDDETLSGVVAACGRRAVSYGMGEAAVIQARNVVYSGLSSQFDCYRGGEFVERFDLALGGSHNVSNALAVIALGLELGIGLGHIRAALRNYQGAQRRLEIKHAGERFMLIDDYAHHPTELRATLAAVKRLKAKRVIAIFQPHRYTRTLNLLDEFGRSFEDADCVVITDIYSAGEPVIEGVTAEVVAGKIRQAYPDKDVACVNKNEVPRYVFGMIRPGDVVLTLGAGDIVKVGEGMIGELKMREQFDAADD